MKKSMLAALVLISLISLPRPGAGSGLSPVPGYRVEPVLTVAGDPGAFSAGIHAFDRDDSGDLYIFSDNQIIKDPAGSAQVLFNYQTTAVIYGSFIRAWGGTIYFGESSLGTVRSVSADGGAASLLFTVPEFRAVPAKLRGGPDFTLPGNFACAFNSQSEMFLSANPGGWMAENKIYYWDGQADPVIVADMGGYSGPIAFDREDNLYYGFTNFPAGPEDVVYFTAAQVEDAVSSGVPLDSSDWTVLARVDACSGFTFDRNLSQNLYSTSSLGTVTRIEGSGETAEIATGSSPSGLSFSPGTGDFEPFVAGSGRLGVLNTDWGDYTSTIYSLEPAARSFVGVFRPSSGLWALRGVTRAYFGASGDRPSPGDFNGDGLIDLAVFRPDSGLWAVRGVTRAYFGTSGDEPAPADYTGDGTAEIAVFRPSSGLWAVRGLTRYFFGASGDQPLPADYSGDGTADIAVFRPASGLWAARGLTRVYFGTSGDRPSPADYTGDGTAEIAVFRPSSGLWAVREVTRAYFGASGDQSLPADYTGDGTVEIAVFRPGSGLWAVRGVTRFYFGTGSDIPVAR